MTFIRVKTPGVLDPGVIRPKLYADPILAPGSLMLVDPTNTAASWGDGTPANGARLPNIADSIAEDILGGTPEVRPQWSFGAQNTEDTVRFDRTTKGGLHGVVTQVPGGMVAANSDVGARLSLPTSILAHMEANPNHVYYASLWHRITRTSGSTTASSTPMLSVVGREGSSTSDYFYAIRSIITRPNTGAAFSGMFPAGDAGHDATGNQRRSIGFSRTGADNTKDGTVAQWGTFGIKPNNPPASNIYPSFILYRYYLEDLTVSGRSYEEVDAIDAAQYSSRVTSSGGDHNGDSFTPAGALP